MQRLSFNTLICFFVALLPVIIPVAKLHAAQLTTVQEQSNGEQKYILQLDHIEKLAGLKISLTYPESLHFQSAGKGEEFKSFLHVVNDKNPGKLILVMASAKGISGKDIPLFTLNFNGTTTNQATEPQKLKIIGCELMSEDLQKIPCDTQTNP